MKVLNPIYDTVFKFLMEDIEIAKGLIALIIEEEVVELIPAPTEGTNTKFEIKYINLPMQRLDYVAILKTKDKLGNDQYQKVSIEVQKSPIAPEIGRFRKYIGEKYSTQSVYKTTEGVQNDYLPLKTIYFIDKTFNKNLPVVLRRKGDYWDVLEEKKYEGEKDRFVELLNHDAWFIQVQLLPSKLKNELLNVLSVFAPWMRDERNDRFIDIPEYDVGIKKYQLLTKIIRRLHLAGESRELETALELEISLENFIDKAISDKEEAKKETAEIRKEITEIEKREAEARKETAEAQQKIIGLAKMLKSLNVPIKQIEEKTGLAAAEIERL